MCVAATADGGPSEQAAVPLLIADFLPAVNLSFRDRCHRTRGIMQQMWEPLNQASQGLLGMFVSDNQSLSKMLKKQRYSQYAFPKSLMFSRVMSGLRGHVAHADLASYPRNSHKYSMLFQQTQLQQAAGFAKCIRNFSYAAQRFDSVTTPLFKAYALLPAILAFLSQLTKVGDAEDQRWGRRILESLTSQSGGSALVSAAMAGDAFLVMEKFLRLDDRSDSTAILKASEALECQSCLG